MQRLHLSDQHHSVFCSHVYLAFVGDLNHFLVG